MKAGIFDTSKLAKTPDDADFPTLPAPGVAAALADTVPEDLETALRTGVQALRGEFKADLRALERRIIIRLGAVVLVGAMVKPP